jgi:hypothetical protein
MDSFSLVSYHVLVYSYAIMLLCHLLATSATVNTRTRKSKNPFLSNFDIGPCSFDSISYYKSRNILYLSRDSVFRELLNFRFGFKKSHVIGPAPTVLQKTISLSGPCIETGAWPYPRAG